LQIFTLDSESKKQQTKDNFIQEMTNVVDYELWTIPRTVFDDPIREVFFNTFQPIAKALGDYSAHVSNRP
jgi:hypothetical protein